MTSRRGESTAHAAAVARRVTEMRLRANRASRQWPAEISGKRRCDSVIPVVLDGRRYRLRVAAAARTLG